MNKEELEEIRKQIGTDALDAADRIDGLVMLGIAQGLYDEVMRLRRLISETAVEALSPTDPEESRK